MERKQKILLAVAIMAVVLLIACIVLFETALKPSMQYRKALRLARTGDYEASRKAYNTLVALGEYKNAEDYLPGLRSVMLKKAKVGDTVFFGNYEQDDETENGKETIEWYVLAKDGSRLLVTSRYTLERGIPYNDVQEDTTWETCTLRRWLNETFLNEAFSEEEQAMIPTVTVPADKHPDYSTNPGNATEDRVFILSLEEALRYLTSDEMKKCEMTDYLFYHRTGSNLKIANWWMRTPGETAQTAVVGMYSFKDSDLAYYYLDVNDTRLELRPAVWIDLR